MLENCGTRELSAGTGEAKEWRLCMLGRFKALTEGSCRCHKV